MDDVRLPTGLWVMAHVRQCNDKLIPAMVLQKGDPDRGTVMIKLSRIPLEDSGSFPPQTGCRVLTQTLDLDGKRAWMRLGIPRGLDDKILSEEEAAPLIRRAMERDPDLWVVEIEDPEGNNPFEGEIL
ncbi:DUF1491 family protein [Kiloniella sp. b19]|uniref:DUF1491 family protein n=1 Tax=Kiloniella sp. GXU_MW_B19 TaxID=3141326 RepID=UPI0031DFEF59